MSTITQIMHADLKIGNARFFVNDVMMDQGPHGFGGSPASFWLCVRIS